MNTRLQSLAVGHCCSMHTNKATSPSWPRPTNSTGTFSAISACSSYTPGCRTTRSYGPATARAPRRVSNSHPGPTCQTLRSFRRRKKRRHADDWCSGPFWAQVRDARACCFRASLQDGGSRLGWLGQLGWRHSGQPRHSCLQRVLSRDRMSSLHARHTWQQRPRSGRGR